MNKIMKIIAVPLVLALAPGPVRAQWDFFISGTDTTDCNDTYLRSNQPSNNYGLDATMLFGSQWNTMTLLIEFPHLPDSLALPAYSGNIDSALVGFVCTGAVESGDTLSMKAYTLKRNWAKARPPGIIIQPQAAGRYPEPKVVTTVSMTLPMIL
jgi:hypothetical protein